MKTQNQHYKNIFNQIQELINTGYVFVDCFSCEIIKTEEDGYRFKDLTNDCYFVMMGHYNDELLLEAFISCENDELKVDKPGHYTFKALVSYSEAQIGEFGRIEVPAYHLIEHIEFKYQCSDVEMQDMLGLNGSDSNFENFEFENKGSLN